MGRSLSLTAYLAYARRGTTPMAPIEYPRPKGAVVWAHAVTPAHFSALIHLARRLSQQRPAATVLITAEGEFSNRATGVLRSVLPEETIRSVETFLDHWRPDICLWTGGNLRPALLNGAYERGIPLFLVDAEPAFLERSSWRWFPDLPRALLQRFSKVMARSDSAVRHLRRLGVSQQDIAVTGPFLESALALPYNESDREEMANLLRGRPIWLAAMLQLSEMNTILNAHREVSRIAHRTLLIAVPDDLQQADEMSAKITEGDWRFCRWSDGQVPDETTQILLADTRGEMGLWYRLAPISLMASSLVPGCHGRDPNEPAAHGSAILYGPNVGRYLATYSRFAEAGAARIVRDAPTLSAALQSLIPPDQAATMAAAAWDVASQGATVTDQILDLLQDTLDLQEAHR